MNTGGRIDDMLAGLPTAVPGPGANVDTDKPVDPDGDSLATLQAKCEALKLELKTAREAHLAHLDEIEHEVLAMGDRAYEKLRLVRVSLKAYDRKSCWGRFWSRLPLRDLLTTLNVGVQDAIIDRIIKAHTQAGGRSGRKRRKGTPRTHPV